MHREKLHGPLAEEPEVSVQYLRGKHMSILKPISGLVAIAAAISSHSVLAVGLPDVPNTHQGKVLPETGVLSSAIATGKSDLSLRLRYEDVNDDIPSSSILRGTEDANLLSLRAALGSSSMPALKTGGRFQL